MCSCGKNIAHAIIFLVVCAHALNFAQAACCERSASEAGGGLESSRNAVLLAEICAAPGEEGDVQ